MFDSKSVLAILGFKKMVASLTNEYTRKSACRKMAFRVMQQGRSWLARAQRHIQRFTRQRDGRLAVSGGMPSNPNF